MQSSSVVSEAQQGPRSSAPNDELQALNLLPLCQLKDSQENERKTHPQPQHPGRSSCHIGIGHRPGRGGHSTHVGGPDTIDTLERASSVDPEQRGSVGSRREKRQKNTHTDVYPPSPSLGSSPHP